MIKKLKVAELIGINSELKDLVEKDTTFPGQIAWSLYSAIREITPHIEAYEKAQQKKVSEMDKEGKLEDTENGGKKIKEEFFSEYYSYMNDIIQNEVELKLVPISEEALQEALKENSFTISMMNILSLLQEEKEDK